MLNYLQHLISDPEQLYQLDENSIRHFPFYFFLKNQVGSYIGCNDSMAQALGFDKGQSLLGCTDFDLCWASAAPSFRENDNKVITTEKPVITIETGKLSNGKNTTAFSYKLPLRLRSKKVAGVICIAIPFDNDELFSPLLNSKNTSVPPYDFSINAIAKKNNLTKRQKDCLHYLVRGMTIKEIAHHLKLSARTVEHYLEAIKIKLDCNSRSQLIAKILEQ